MNAHPATLDRSHSTGQTRPARLDRPDSPGQSRPVRCGRSEQSGQTPLARMSETIASRLLLPDWTRGAPPITH